MNIFSIESFKHNLRIFYLTALVFVGLLLFQSCGSDSIGGISYENAPPLPDTSNAVKALRFDDGLRIYVMKEGYSDDPFEVTSNDEIQVHYTGRTADDGEIFESTYINDYESPRIFNNLTPDRKETSSGVAGPLIDGFRRGLLGMKVGEKRLIYIPPELGYGGQDGHRLREETLIFDVELLRILN